MNWFRSNRADQRSAVLADRHYSRQKPGTPQFVAPARNIVLARPGLSYLEYTALWVSTCTLHPRHEWPGAWCCSLFRNESSALSSQLITEAVAVTLHFWGPVIPAHGFITFINEKKIRRKRDPGRCFRKAGFRPVGRTRERDLLVLQLRPDDFPPAQMPLFQLMGEAV